MNCNEVTARLSALVDGELAAGERGEVEAHLERCTACAGAYASLRAAVDALRASGPTATSPALAASILAAVDAEASASADVAEDTFRRAAGIAGAREVARSRWRRLATHVAAALLGAAAALLFFARFARSTEPARGPLVVDRIVEVPVEVRVEVPVEVPVERVVERRVEVPVEKRVEVPVIEYVEREPMPVLSPTDVRFVAAVAARVAEELRREPPRAPSPEPFLDERVASRDPATPRDDRREPGAVLVSAAPDAGWATGPVASLVVVVEEGRVQIETHGSLGAQVEALLTRLGDPDHEVVEAVRRRLDGIRRDAERDPELGPLLVSVERVEEERWITPIGGRPEPQDESWEDAWLRWWDANAELLAGDETY